MKTKRTIIAACIATLFISGTVFAKDSWEYHESGWNNVKSYGKVVIAQDSVGHWGPWEDFVEPAAGAPAPVAMPGMSAGDQYRKTPDIIVIPEDKGCATGAWCGYAIFRNSADQRESYNERSYYKPSNPWTGALFTLMPTPDDPSITAGEGRGPGSIAWQLDSLGAILPTFSESAGAIPADFGGGWWFTGDDGLHHFHTDAYAADVNGVSHNMFSSEARNTFGSGPFEQAITGQMINIGSKWRPIWVRIAADEQVAVGDFSQMTVYVKGESRSMERPPVAQTEGYYVAGIATPQAYLASQQASNIRANYVGGSFDGSRQGSVAIQVQFGPATWQGQWESSAMSFQAAGNITGANIAATNISALSNCDRATYSGYVQGTFYGEQAGSIGGVSSVTKTSVAPQVEARTIVQTPVTQTQTAIFLVNKVPTVQTPSSVPR
ncbi:MAG: hypothetical protein H6R13_501 [Proteobacteria bacterium]|nr:hypothetical protein [Pseudomonadota bacterium]